jgi:hypothetical protein
MRQRDRHRMIQRQNGDLILKFKNKEIRLKISYVEIVSLRLSPCNLSAYSVRLIFFKYGAGGFHISYTEPLKSAWFT